MPEYCTGDYVQRTYGFKDWHELELLLGEKIVSRLRASDELVEQYREEMRAELEMREWLKEHNPTVKHLF